MGHYFSRDGNGIPKCGGFGAAWDTVDSGTGFVRSENRVASKNQNSRN